MSPIKKNCDNQDDFERCPSSRDGFVTCKQRNYPAIPVKPVYDFLCISRENDYSRGWKQPSFPTLPRNNDPFWLYLHCNAMMTCTGILQGEDCSSGHILGRLNARLHVCGSYWRL